jgi:Lon protease-like protein
MSGQTSLPSTPIDLPLLPLRDVVVFPHMVIPLFVGRPKSIKALESAMEAERRIMLVAQKAAAKDEPSVEDMFEVGCVATILQLLKLPDGTVKVLVEGQQRATVNKIEEGEQHFTANVTPVETAVVIAGDKTSEIEALRRAVMQQFDHYVKLNKKIPPEILTSISSIDDAGRLADTIAAHLPLKLDAKQVILDLDNVKARLENLYEQLEREVDILNVDKKIRGRVKRQMEKNQRDFYLNEQVKAIQKELGEGEEGADIEEIEKKIKSAKMPQEARKKPRASSRSSSSCHPCLLKRRWCEPTSTCSPACHGARRPRSSTTWATPRTCSMKTTTAWKRSKTVSLNISRCSNAWTSSRRRFCASWASRRGQNLPGSVDRQGDRAQVRAHGAGRHAGRSRNSWPSPHLHRCFARQGFAKPDQGRHPQSAVPA